jgi:hypothetical protein
VLPDLPRLKSDIQKVLMGYLRVKAHQNLGVFAQSPRHVAHEGNRLYTLRADGSETESEFAQATGELTVHLAEVPQLTIQERIAKLDAMADDMARQMSERLFGSLDEVLKRSGQSVDQEGQPLSAETILAALELIEMDFDKPPELSVVIPPALQEKAAIAFHNLKTDPVLNRRYEDLMARKRLDWRARETARTLVG